MAERVAVKGDISGERVLQVAAHLFREKGYLATSVRDIARAANMESGSLYYHYPSKDALLEAVMDRAIGALHDAVKNALAELTPEHTFQDRLRVAITAHLRTIHQYGDFAVASRESLDKVPEKSRKQHVRRRRQYGQLWHKLFDDAKASGAMRKDVEVAPVQMFILGALNWTSEWLDPQRTTVEQASDLLADMVLNGLLTGRPQALASSSREYRAGPCSCRRTP